MEAPEKALPPDFDYKSNVFAGRNVNSDGTLPYAECYAPRQIDIDLIHPEEITRLQKRRMYLRNNLNFSNPSSYKVTPRESKIKAPATRKNGLGSGRDSNNRVRYSQTVKRT
jgi:hypothetical protein